MFIEWNITYSVGIDEIDYHHKTLFELLDRSYFLILEENNKNKLSELFYELIDYSHYHFSAEERLMIKYDYPNIDYHILEHLNYTYTVLNYEKMMVEDNDDIPYDVFEFVKRWLFEHILNTDFEMGQFIQSRQLNMNRDSN